MNRTHLAFAITAVVAFALQCAALAHATPSRTLACAYVDSEAHCAYVAITGSGQ